MKMETNQFYFVQGKRVQAYDQPMMTSWHGNTFRISGHFVRGILWSPAHRASDVELWCFIWCQAVGQCRVAGDLSRLMRLPSFQKRRDKHLCTLTQTLVYTQPHLNAFWQLTPYYALLKMNWEEVLRGAMFCDVIVTGDTECDNTFRLRQNCRNFGNIFKYILDSGPCLNGSSIINNNLWFVSGMIAF